jgi:hypothetical protein
MTKTSRRTAFSLGRFAGIAKDRRCNGIDVTQLRRYQHLLR